MGVVCDVEDAPECELYDVRDCTERCQEEVHHVPAPEPVHVEARHTPPPPVVHHHQPVRYISHSPPPVYIPPPVHYSPRKTY